MAKQTTDTSGRTLVPENHYSNVMILKVNRKEIKEFIIYEWVFESEEGNFKIGMFSSQMAELLRALGATETSPNKFDWDDEAVIGEHLSFNIVHVADKKGVIREQLSDIKKVTASINPSGVNKPEDIAWTDEDKK